ncbi:MAG: SPASM domain-containing protein [Candidatus Eisenbacteria bacterium]|nr:SPASM domain-containing protein [Candidatus Eisenbacteria bacterium]
MPNLKSDSCGVCIAVKPDSFTIAPDGTLYKCWEEPGGAVDKPCGHILRDMRSPAELSRDLAWVNWKEWQSDECQSCSYLPMCMGGCTRVVQSTNRIGDKYSETCEHWFSWVPMVARLRYHHQSAKSEPLEEEVLLEDH